MGTLVNNTSTSVLQSYKNWGYDTIHFSNSVTDPANRVFIDYYARAWNGAGPALYEAEELPFIGFEVLAPHDFLTLRNTYNYNVGCSTRVFLPVLHYDMTMTVPNRALLDVKNKYVSISYSDPRGSLYNKFDFNDGNPKAIFTPLNPTTMYYTFHKFKIPKNHFFKLYNKPVTSASGTWINYTIRIGGDGYVVSSTTTGQVPSFMMLFRNNGTFQFYRSFGDGTDPNESVPSQGHYYKAPYIWFGVEIVDAINPPAPHIRDFYVKWGYTYSEVSDPTTNYNYNVQIDETSHPTFLSDDLYFSYRASPGTNGGLEYIGGEDDCVKYIQEENRANINILGELRLFNYDVVTQTTDIETTVTIDKVCGYITTFNATTAGGASSSFDVNNSFVNSGDIVQLQIIGYSGAYGTNGFPVLTISDVTLGLFTINIRNYHASNALNGSLTISFFIIKID